MKVLFIAHGFPPAQHSGVFRSQAFAKYLPEYGIDPVVLAAVDAPRVLPYPSRSADTKDSASCPVFRIDWGLQSPPMAMAKSVRLLLRVPFGATLAKRQWRKESSEQVLRLARQIIKDHCPAVIYASSPPEEAALMAVQLGRQTGLPVVCDLRDVWSYGFEKRYRHIVDFWLERRLEQNCLSQAQRVIANTPTAKNLLVTLMGLDKEKVVCIPNGFDEEDFAGMETDRELEPGKFTVVYTGVLAGPVATRKPFRTALKRAFGIDFHPVRTDTTTRSPLWFLKAAEAVLDRKPEFRNVLRILFVGNYTESELAPLQSFRYPECVSAVPAVPRREAIALCCRANLLLLLQVSMTLKGHDYSTAVPAKLFDYLRSGTRILAPLQESDAADLIRRFHAGVVVPPRDVNAIAAALEDEINRWKNGGENRRTAPSPELRRYERRALAEQLAEILRAAVPEKEKPLCLRL
jgi:glycosyltransferase involved in cell wall biosynthesis